MHQLKLASHAQLLTYVSLLLVATIWGGTFIAGRVAAPYAPPEMLAFLRFAAAGVALTVMRPSSIFLLKKQNCLIGLALGFFAAFSYNLCFFKALSAIPAGRCALMVSLNPVFTALGACFIFQEKLNKTRLAGIALSFIGVIYVLSHGAIFSISSQVGLGELCMLGAVLSWTLYTLLGRKFLSQQANLHTPFDLVYLASIFGAGLLFLAAARQISSAVHVFSDKGALLSIVYLGVVGTALAFSWYYRGIQKIGATRASAFNNFVPISGILLGHFLLGEPINTSTLIGTPLVIVGVFLTNRVG